MLEAVDEPAATNMLAAVPDAGLPSQLAYLTRVLKTPTIGRCCEELAMQGPRRELVTRPGYLAALLGRQVADPESAGTTMRIRALLTSPQVQT